MSATARAYGVEPVMFKTMAHDMMLEPDWRKLADAILAWVETLEGVAPQSGPLRRVSADNEREIRAADEQGVLIRPPEAVRTYIPRRLGATTRAPIRSSNAICPSVAQFSGAAAKATPSCAPASI